MAGAAPSTALVEHVSRARDPAFSCSRRRRTTGASYIPQGLACTLKHMMLDRTGMASGLNLPADEGLAPTRQPLVQQEAPSASFADAVDRHGLDVWKARARQALQIPRCIRDESIVPDTFPTLVSSFEWCQRHTDPRLRHPFLGDLCVYASVSSASSAIEAIRVASRGSNHAASLTWRAVPNDSVQPKLFGMRGVNYFRLLTTTISAGRDRQGASPTTRRHSVIVVGRLVAVENVSAGAPIGA
jgi:hypothetical protein